MSKCFPELVKDFRCTWDGEVGIIDMPQKDICYTDSFVINLAFSAT